MSCEEMKILISGLVDGELGPEDKKRVCDHLVSCDSCRNEYAKLKKLKEVTDDMKYYDLPDKLLAGYWTGIYNRIERGLGWIFLSIGIIIILGFAAWKFLEDFLLNNDISIIVRFGVAAFVIGIIIFTVSIIRERMFSKKHDRYDEVEI
jgi:predicted anti-sigma-YlaC factor YlaD